MVEIEYNYWGKPAMETLEAIFMKSFTELCQPGGSYYQRPHYSICTD
jgi:hypothetical protein